MKQSITLFGGTFDPVHFGHLRAALEIRELLGAEDFRFLPAGDPPHRSGLVTAADQRLDMLQLAIGSSADFQIDQRELHRPGKSYMVDTLTALNREAPDRPLILLVGQDSANTLNLWHRWHELFSLCHLVVMRRHGEQPEYQGALADMMATAEVEDAKSLHEQKSGAVLHAEINSFPVSSSGIRALVRNGRSPQYLLPDPVCKYIEEHSLYQP